MTRQPLPANGVAWGMRGRGFRQQDAEPTKWAKPRAQRSEHAVPEGREPVPRSRIPQATPFAGSG